MTIQKPFAFYSSTASMLTSILDEAWRELVDARDPRVLNETLTRDQVATRIMQSALLGERNPARLKAEATVKAAWNPAGWFGLRTKARSRQELN